MKGNTTLQEHKDNYLRIRQKLKTFQLLDNENIYTSKNLMDTIICPLIAYPNHLVVKRVNDILCKKVIPYLPFDSDIDAEFDELTNIIKNFRSGYQKSDLSNHNASVNVTKNSGKVNSAHGSAHKSLRDKIQRTRNAEESNSKPSSNPHTDAYVKAKFRNGSTETPEEILSNIVCNKCGGKRHIAKDCRKTGIIKKPVPKKADTPHPKKNFNRGKKGTVRFTRVNNSEDSDEDEEDTDGMMGYVRMMKAVDLDEVPPLAIDSEAEDFNYDDMPSLCSHALRFRFQLRV